MNVPFADLKAQYKSIKNEIDEAIQLVIEETAFIGGMHVSDFAENYQRIYGVNHCVPVANGTDSLYIIMKMLGIGAGDEVIVPAISWISSSETISQTGAKPVFVDIDPTYFTIDEKKIEQAISERTKAIMPVHLYGGICEMEVINEIAKRHQLFVIEDCAQAHFSEFNSKRAGLFGDAGSFSFYPGKNLGAYGDAGCIVTNNDLLALNCKKYATHGSIVKHAHEFEGINSRLDGLQAAILNVKLKYVQNWIEHRIKHAAYYSELLSKVDEVSIPVVRINSKHSFHLYVIKCERRDELQSFLKKNGVATGIHYPKILPDLEAYQYLKLNPEDYTVSRNIQKEILSLPLYPEMTTDQIEYVVQMIKQFYSNKLL